MLALVTLLSLASDSAAGVDLGCDTLCHLRGLWLSCRLHIDWSKSNEFKNDPTACHSAHEHVLSACLPYCSGCAVESLGAGCANEATTVLTNTTTTTTITAATTTTTKAATTTTQLAITTTMEATTTKTTTGKTTAARTTSKTGTNETDSNTTTRLTTSNTAFTTPVASTNRKRTTRSSSTVAGAVEPLTTINESADKTSSSHKRVASNLNASEFKRHPADTASGASGVKQLPLEIRNSSADAADAAIDKHHLSSTTWGTSESASVNGTASKTIKKIPVPTTASSSNSNSQTTKSNRTAGPVAAGALAARNTSSSRTRPHVSETKAATTKTVTTETATETAVTTPAREVQNGTTAEVAAVSKPVGDSCARLGCTNEYRPAVQCQCNDACEAHGTCCPDYRDHCAAFAQKHEASVRLLTARMGVIAPVVSSSLALTVLLGWFAARRGWLTYSGRSPALRAMPQGGRSEETDALDALMQPAPGEVEFMSSP